MFRTKKDVDRHVQNIFGKLRNENEKNLRCYNVAKLYYQVGDYESAKRYVSSYLEVRDGSANAHKLLGQAYEALGQKEAAFNEFKTSLELEGRQDDLVLKVCELLIDMDIGMDVNKIKYWVERADNLFPHHSVVFQLKEKLLTVERPNSKSEDLEALIASELTARPNDVQLRVKLLKHYMSKHKFDNAYEHAASVEATHSYRNSIVWYQTLCELLTKCKETKHSDLYFWILYISVLERFTALCIKEQGSEMKMSVPEATHAVFNLDQNLNELKLKDFPKHHILLENIFIHMWGQLHFHLACLLLRKTKREQGSWSEAGRLCTPLLLTALHVAPMDVNAAWTLHVKDQPKTQINLWHVEGSYRCSQTGHILQNYSRDNTKKMMDKIDKFCTGKWRERIYQRIFVSRLHLDRIRNSYFCNHSISNPLLRLCSQNEIKCYDEIAEQVWPDSLHHHIWLGIQSRSYNLQNKEGSPQPHQYSHVFPELQFSVYNMSQAAPDSLSLLDIDAFLNAAIICSSAVVEELQLGSFLSPDRLPTLPADLTPTLCTCNQEKWWSAAYKMYSKQKDIENDIGELRQELQLGLEAVRCIGNHGLHPVLLVHLARIFQYRAKVLKEKDKEHSDISALETRAELYWSTVVPLLERLQNNQAIRLSTSRLFNYQGKEMNNVELTNALEEGKLLLAQKLVRDKQYEQAIDALQVLKCPDASFQQAQIYKMFADEIVNSMPRESLTSEMRAQHIIMLSKARNCFYLTLDRLRSPGMNPKHPLNSELATHIADIENELKRIDPDLGRGDLSRNDCDGISDESYSPAHSAVDQTVNNTTLPALTALTVSQNILSTPQRNTQRTPKQTSTPYRPQHHDLLDLSRNRTEARPSPERLDAQIRQLMHSRDNEIQELTDQMKGMMDHMKTLTEKMDALMKEVVETRKDNQKQQQQQQQQQRAQQQHQQMNVNANIEDDFFVLGDDEYADLNYANQTGQTAAASAISGNLFTPPHRHPYSSLMYPAATAFQGYYQGGIPGFSDPNAQAIPPLYSHNVYPMPVLYPNRSKIPDNLLQQGFFASRLPPQLSDLMPIPTTNPAPLQIPLQKVDPPKPETTTIIKDAPVNKAPPVNVVITSSDTLPTTAPLVQPTLSVTIPPQYRQGGAPAGVATPIPVTATELSEAPHCFQLSMPSQATIPTTVNLPPLPPTLTTSPASMQAMQIADAHRLGMIKMDNSGALYQTPNTSTEIYETEHDPIPDFMPIIPLPAEVKVTTGEENEVTLYCARAKLFRHIEKEWKERGVGDVKLLRNAEGKVRLLMRRDQVLKICANHMLRPDMELTAMPNNKKAWCWFANDFADEQVKLEKFCIRFKTEEDALSFKEAFDRAKLSLTAEKTSKIVGDKKTVSDKKTLSTINDKDTSKTQKSQPSPQIKIGGVTTLGGFSFSTKPIVQEVSDAETTSESKKSEEPSKVSPFSGFSFTQATTAAITSPPISSTGFVFATTTVTALQSKSGQNTVPVTSSTTFTAPASTFDQNSPQSILRRPRLPPPGTLKTGSEKKVRPQAESELKLYDGKANLQCQNSETKQWENKGEGSVALLLDGKTRKLRLLLTVENSKILYGHGIPLDMAFTFKSGTTVVNWTASADGKESGKTLLIYAATFKTSESASQFYNVVSSCQQKLGKGGNPIEIAKGLTKKTSGRASNKSDNAAVVNRSQPLSELFKPAVGSWECSSCLIRNNVTDVVCMACGSPSSSVTSDKKTAETNIQPAAKSDKPPLSELFKLAAGSWNCQGCYLINSGVNVYCVACDKPKDPSLPPKPQTNAFQLNASSTTTFSFGISKDSTKETTGFCFQVPKAEDKSAGDVFATPSSQTEETGGFVFKPTKPMLNSGDARFTFSSPPKSYGFNFTARSPSKSPGGGGETNEEEVVESDDIHFSPVIPLPEKIDVKTGEEDEEILYTHRAKLFRFDINVKEWKERGLGDIKLLRHKETDKLRLIMRRDHVLKLCLNHLLSAEIEFQVKDEKTWLWNAADYSEGEIEYMQFACRFKTSEIAEDFKRVIDNARKGIRSAIASNSEKVIKPTTKTVELPPKEIEIVYELKVTPEEKAAALKLQLPENFYAYKQKKDCPGCRGCRRPSIVLYPDDATTKETIKKVSEEKKTSELTNIATSKLVVPSATVTSSPSSNFQNIEAPSHVTQSTAKSEFSFAIAPTTTFASSSVFDGSAMSFGTGDLKLYNDKKSTTFSFGMNPQFAVNEMTEKTTTAPDKQNVLSENLKICSPNVETAPATTSNITGQSIFSQTSTTSIFKAPTFTFDTSKNIFGGTSKITPKITIFGGSSIDGSSPFANTFNVTPAITTTNSVPITSTGATYGTGSLFGSMVMQPNSQANDTATTIIPEQSRNPIFTGAVPFSDTTPSDGTQKSDDIAAANFFSNATTFAALATKAAQPEAFKTDPNFSFAGAGSSVFGSKSNAESSNTPKNRSKTARENSKQKDNNEEDDGEVDNEQEYDPQFEPIVPLPDAIEIRTGEEDEEKVFCERAKLYRYSDKEWKERGVGEMKILHHAGFGSYRLLLRREQVYKVVCNFLLTSDVTFQPLAMSEQAWMWAGMNHAEGEANVEKLAVKFKSIQLAKEFKRHIDRIQLELRERSIQGERCVVGEVEESGQDQDDDEEKDEDDEEEVEEDEEEEDDEDDQEIVPIMEKRATVYARCPSEANWQRVGLGTLAIYYDSEIYAERIVFKLDNSEEYAVNTIISMETVMEVEGKECIWSGIDYAFDPAVKRVLRAVFSSVQAAQEMYGFFEEGLNSAKQAGVVEYDEDTQ